MGRGLLSDAVTLQRLYSRFSKHNQCHFLQAASRDRLLKFEAHTWVHVKANGSLLELIDHQKALNKVQSIMWRTTLTLH